MTHDYMRYGTTTLFAALNTLDGTVMTPAWSAIAIRSGSSSRVRSNAVRQPCLTALLRDALH
jgi:hypothetical protein